MLGGMRIHHAGGRFGLLAAIAALVLGGCGGGGKGSGDEQGTTSGAPVQGKTGGKLTMLWTDDTDNIDPGITYYQMGIMLSYATQRPLYNWKPDDSEHPVPDLAEAAPEIAADGCTVTVKLRQGVKFSPPVNRAVTANDVKYAIERGFFSTVSNGYVGAYFGDLRGARVGAKPGTAVPGIRTPDDQTLVFKLEPRQGGRCSGGVLAGALAMPVTGPVPEEYAAKFDRENPSSYGAHQVASGPYMVENDASGKAIGYQAGKGIHLVRNPNWDKATDFKPAYIDEFDMPQGNDDTTVASRKILDGSHQLSGDFSPPPAILKQTLQRDRSLLSLVPGSGIRWVVMNTTIKPFDNADVRRAVVAGFDRNAMRLTRGGELVGDIPTHLLNPGLPGFEEAGGMEGPGLDFMANPAGDPELAAEYFRKAGYASGRYTGSNELLMVGTSEGVAQKAAEVAKENFEKLGFKVRLRLVTQDAMYTKFCNVPKANVAICPNYGWLKDFADGQTFLDPNFNGKNILPVNNSNLSQLDDPEINAAMAKAEVLIDPAERAKAWGEIDRLVTALAPVVPWIWDRQPLIRSPDVNGVVNRFNAQWDLAFSSLE
jgi:peptide/nickel transport system substrate-binding protein